MKELLKEYLHIIKNIQECRLDDYELICKITRLHQKIADYLGIKNEAEYIRLRAIFSHMGLICGLYFAREEKLNNNTDVDLMADNLRLFLCSSEAKMFIQGDDFALKQLGYSAEARMFIQGDVAELKQLPCFKR